MYCSDDDFGGSREVLIFDTFFFFLFDLGVRGDLRKVPVSELGTVIL